VVAVTDKTSKQTTDKLADINRKQGVRTYAAKGSVLTTAFKGIPLTIDQLDQAIQRKKLGTRNWNAALRAEWNLERDGDHQIDMGTHGSTAVSNKVRSHEKARLK